MFFASGELDEVYSVPPFPTEEIVGFRLVPTVEKLRGPDATPTPALLLLTHSLVSYDDEDEDDQDEDADETRKGTLSRVRVGDYRGRESIVPTLYDKGRSVERSMGGIP